MAGHRPVYGMDDGKDALFLAVEPLFRKYHVDVYFAGHVHAYERSWPVADYVVGDKSYNKPKDPVYVIQGAGGNTEGHSTWGNSTIKPWLANINGFDYGMGKLSVTDDTLHWQFLRGIDGTVADEFTIRK